MLNPAEKGRAIDRNATLTHHLFKVAIADSIFAVTGVRLGIEQIHLVIEWIIAVGVVSALKGAGKLDFFERVNGQNL